MAANVSGSLRTRPEYISRCRSTGISAYSEVESFALRSATVVLAGTVRAYFASLDDLMLKVT